MRVQGRLTTRTTSYYGVLDFFFMIPPIMGVIQEDASPKVAMAGPCGMEDYSLLCQIVKVKVPPARNNIYKQQEE